MAQVLGRVTGSVDGPRGPDVVHRVSVPGEWLDEGALLELELPRHLTCAACGGGGCDACERSGALTLRGKAEPPELVEVRLPARLQAREEAASSRRNLMIRVPDRGGFPPEGSELRRGWLLLSVVEGAEPERGLRRVDAPSERLSLPGETPGTEIERRSRSVHPEGVAPSVKVAGVLVALWIAGLVLVRLMGWG